MTYGASGSFVLAVLAAARDGARLGLVLELSVVSRLYTRDHLDHVLATFGLVLFFNELVRIIWGPHRLHERAEALSGTVDSWASLSVIPLRDHRRGAAGRRRARIC